MNDLIAVSRPLKVLYLSYDGMTDPLGRSQVLPYLVGLSRLRHRIELVSFEKPERLENGAISVDEICSHAGIGWQPLRYHKNPPIISSVIDLSAMMRRAARLQCRHGFDLVHCRSYMPAIIGASLKRRFGIPFLFDMRGFWIEERVEMGLWPLDKPAFRAVHSFFKNRERELLRDADAIVSLTETARSEMSGWQNGESIASRTEVIPCCVDFRHFDLADGIARQRGRGLLGVAADTPLFVYVGSLGGNYLLGEMLDAFTQFRRRYRDAKFLLLSHHPPADIVSAAGARGVAADQLIIRTASREEVPLLIAAADLGVAFKRASFSSKACSPTKIGEMLAMGVPVIANEGVGDTAEIIRDTGAGAVIDRFDELSLAGAIRQVEDAALSPDAVRAAARRWFALEDGVARYNAIYQRLGAVPASRARAWSAA